MTTIGEIFEIPDSVHQGDFVLRLTEGVQGDRRKRTWQQYVVTPQLVECFDQALSLIESAVSSNSSKGAYLHGSFGSGKSHFMAMLDFLLEGDTEARSITQLASAVSKHNRWWQGGKFLVVPFHMIGADSMEAAILGGYANYIRQNHTDAPTPGFYRSQALLENADGLRRTMGDNAFFAALGGGDGGSDGWGDFSSGWDADSYAKAAEASPDDAEHQRLVGDLVDTFFTHLHSETSVTNYVNLDRGLAVMSRHAQNLGYTTVVLFLDELILWLASHSQDQAFLAREGQKVSKLVEASDADRPIPIVSFIARQRDLRELVGKSVPGADRLAFDDVLRWWEARFDEITLEDRNLPAIIEQRLLRVRGDEQRQQLREAFEKTAATRQEVLDILLTHEGDKQMFERVYPFSPALVQALVALSGLLQRERTALKLMLQLLVQNRDRLELGDVIPVGDLFDVIIEADEPFMASTKSQFDRARDVWKRKFVPLLEAEHEVSDQAVRDGEADPDTIRRYRAHAGLLKTLLLSALAPDVEALRNLTPQRLAALNHGTIRSPLPNGEFITVLTKVRDWASHAGEIQISADTSNPLISLQLSGVDVEGVLENARNVDNVGNRVRTVKELLFADIGIDTNGGDMLTPEYTWLWRGRQRRAELLLRNVRECSDDNFRPGDGLWRLLIDYPFDPDTTRGPADDRARADEFEASVQTLVWLPSFFNARALDDLGRLGVLNHVLSGNRLQEYGAHLQPAERSEARATLQNQRDQLEQRVRAALKQAYGIAQGAEAHIDTTHSLDEHFMSLYDGLRLQPPPGGDFKQSLEHLLDQALSSQYPTHPKFTSEVKRGGLRRAWAVLGNAVNTSDGRYGMERSHREEIRGIVEPLKLANCGEGHLVLSDHWRNHIERMMARDEVTTPTVRQLREWLDEPDPMGLDDDIADLIILTWAAQTGRSIFLHNAPVPAEPGKLNREAELREQELPPEDQWQKAVQRAADIFGATGTGAGRNAGNVSALSQALETHASEKQSALADYRKALAERLKSFGMDNAGARARTAAASADLTVALATGETSERIRALATATVDTSAAAMGCVMARASNLTEILQSPQWDAVKAIRQRRDDAARAIVDSLCAALEDDEHVTGLEQQLSEQYQRALALMQPSTPLEPSEPPEPPPGTLPPEPTARSVRRRGATAHAARELLQEIERALADDPALRADIECRLYTQETDESKA